MKRVIYRVGDLEIRADWDGGNQEIIIPQSYGVDDDLDRVAGRRCVDSRLNGREAGRIAAARRVVVVNVEGAGGAGRRGGRYPVRPALQRIRGGGWPAPHREQKARAHTTAGEVDEIYIFRVEDGKVLTRQYLSQRRKS